MAERRLAVAEARIRRLTLPLPWRWITIAPGDLVKLSGRPGLWRVEERRIEGLGIVLVCAGWPEAPVRARAQAASGRALLRPAVPAPPTRLVILETCAPVWPGHEAELVVVAGGEPGWRGANVRWRAPAAVDDLPLFQPASSPPMGETLSPLAPGVTATWDWSQTLELRLLDPDATLESRAERAVLQGANLLVVGDELIQFRWAEERSAGVWRISGLLRGRLGTDARAHAAGEAWALLLPGRFARLPLRPAWTGGTVTVEATGPGDTPEPAIATLTVRGRANHVMGPCHVTAQRTPQGDLELAWVERSGEFEWIESPAGSRGEFVVEILPAGGSLPVWRSAPLRATATVVPGATIRAALGPAHALADLRIETVGAGPIERRRSSALRLVL